MCSLVNHRAQQDSSVNRPIVTVHFESPSFFARATLSAMNESGLELHDFTVAPCVPWQADHFPWWMRIMGVAPMIQRPGCSWVLLT